MKTNRPRLLTFPVLRAGFVLILFLAGCAVGIAIWFDRAHTLAAGVRDTRNLAIAFSGQIEQSVQSIDVVLRGLQREVGELEFDSAGKPLIPDLYEVRQSLVQRLELLPQAHQIVLADPRGQLLGSTAAWPTPDINVEDREYFQELKANDDDRLSISLPFVNRATGETIIVLARRLIGPDRRFAGVVFVSVSTRHFEAIYETIDALADQTFALMRRDGTLMLRYPDTGNRTIDRVPPNSQFHSMVRNGGGVYKSNGAFEPVVRWVAVSPLREYPLAVTMASPENAILATWRMHTTAILAGMAIFFACSLSLLSIMTRQHHKLSESQSQLRREHAALLAKEESLDACINNISQGVVMFDTNARLVLCNDLFARMYGFAQEELTPGVGLRDVLLMRQQSTGFPTDVDNYIQKLLVGVARHETVMSEFKCRDGRIIEMKRHPMKNGGWVTMHEDITARRRAEAKIESLAHSDLLTGIANRSQFLNQINRARERLQTSGQPFAVFMIDLDHFKHVNDTLGHAAGDALLKEIVRRLRSSLRTDDVPARLGGDEFAIIQSPPRAFEPGDDVTQIMRDSAIVLANRIIELIGRPFEIDGHKVVVGASIGIAMAPEHGVDPDELMKRADLALYKIKSEGRNGFTFFGCEMAEEADVRCRLETDLRAGLARNEFELFYQPLVDMATRQPCGMEALVRWNHPNQGLIMPDRFIALAEESGLIASLGEWIIQTACAEAVKWPPHLKVAVNVSPAQFSKTNLLDVIMCALVESGLSPERLEIEITEQVLLADEATHIGVLHQLKSLGIGIALDDFGTGYASLSYLNMFPFDKIKIDRSFTREILERTECAAIICAVANLGRSLGIVALAEGVETEEQMHALRAAGISHAQGFLFGRPVPVAQLKFDAVA